MSNGDSFERPDQNRILAQVLRQIRRDVADALLPEVSTAYGKYTATTVATMLDHLAHWLDTGGDGIADDERKELLARLDGREAATGSTLTADFDDRSRVAESLEARLGATREDVTAALATIEHAAFKREASAIAAAVTDNRAAIEAIEIPVTAERLDRYFDGSKLFKQRRTRSVVRIPGGYSKDTFLVETEGGQGPSELVIRRDFPFGPTETSAADEYDVLARVAASGLPVARPLAAERDRSLLGQPFLVVEKMPGANAGVLFAEDPALARSGSLELARILGRLHAIDPLSTRLPDADSTDPAEAVRRYIARWRAHWMRYRIHPVPVIQAAFAWLDRNVPQDIPRAVLVHGDARPDNMLVDNGRVSALLDWEFAHVGDPAQDLEYTRLFVEPFIDWASFLQAYLDAGGVRVTDAGSRFYEVWRSVRNFVCCDVSWGGFVTQRYPSIKLSAQGVIWRRYFIKTTAEALERVA